MTIDAVLIAARAIAATECDCDGSRCDRCCKTLALDDAVAAHDGTGTRAHRRYRKLLNDYAAERAKLADRYEAMIEGARLSLAANCTHVNDFVEPFTWPDPYAVHLVCAGFRCTICKQEKRSSLAPWTPPTP
jgi:hypothetical protein